MDFELFGITLVIHRLMSENSFFSRESVNVFLHCCCVNRPKLKFTPLLQIAIIDGD